MNIYALRASSSSPGPAYFYRQPYESFVSRFKSMYPAAQPAIRATAIKWSIGACGSSGTSSTSSSNPVCARTGDAKLINNSTAYSHIFVGNIFFIATLFYDQFFYCACTAIVYLYHIYTCRHLCIGRYGKDITGNICLTAYLLAQLVIYGHRRIFGGS